RVARGTPCAPLSQTGAPSGAQRTARPTHSGSSFNAKAPAGACVFGAALHYGGVSAEQSPPKKRGCFFYGCLSLIILSVAGVLVGYLAIRHVFHWLVAGY